MKRTILLFFFIFSTSSQAHDEGHGPKIADAAKYGGVVAAVIAKSESSLGKAAKLLYKAELVRSADGVVRVYLLEANMKLLETKKFDNQASAVVAFKVKGKWKDLSFVLEKKEGVYLGKMPNPESKPFNIDIVFREGGVELMSAFDNLD
jgi:hypothetical protein